MNTNHTIRARLAAGVTAALLLSAAAGSALAQGAAVGGSFDQPMTAKGARAPAGAARSTIMMRTTEGDDTYEVSIVDGEVTAKVNGKAVPADRIRRSKDKVEILGKDGNVLQTFNVTAGPGAIFGGEGQPFFFRSDQAPQGVFRLFQGPGEGAQAFGIAAEPPKVMVGITMSDPTDQDRERCKLEEGQGIVVDRVIEGLPADKAGLKQGDVIVSVNGQPLNSEGLRELLKDKDEGDSLKIRFFRDGAEKSAKVELQKYDPEKLGMTINIAPRFQDSGKDWAEAVAKAQKEAEKAYREALKWQQQAGKGQGGAVLGVGPDQLEWWSTPPGARADKRVTELNDRIDKLDARLADLDKRLAKLAESLEKLAEQRRP
jgi:sulfur carrier protein ThiS